MKAYTKSLRRALPGWPLAALALVWAGVGCSSQSGLTAIVGGATPPPGAMPDGGTPGAVAGKDAGWGVGGQLSDTTTTSSDASGAEGGRAPSCTDAGCTCIRIASFGHVGDSGACGTQGDSTSALVEWLNTQSTARVDLFAESKPTLTPAFLAQYDVIILQWLRDFSDAGKGALWAFSSDEVAALAAWVEAGGGLITLSGYDEESAEVTPLNTLLSFSSFAYNQDTTNSPNDAGGACWGGANELTGWNKSTAIGAHITSVGMVNGRSIAVAPDAGAVTVDCPCADNPNACAAHQDIGKGHVFAFADEWVTYTSQWLGTSQCIPPSCASTPATDFQVPQFWYNAVRYASSSVTCFKISDPSIVP